MSRAFVILTLLVMAVLFGWPVGAVCLVAIVAIVMDHGPDETNP